MPNVLVDSDIENTPEALKLAELTGDARAWIYAFRLWSWGIKHNLLDGKMRQTGDQLCAICAPPRRLRGHLLGYLIDAGFVRQGGDQLGSYFFLCGWDRNMSYLNEKKYDRDRKKAEKIKRFSDGNSDGTDEEFRRKFPGNSGSKPPSSHSSSSSSSDLASLAQKAERAAQNLATPHDDPIAANAAKAATDNPSDHQRRVVEAKRAYLEGMRAHSKLLMNLTLTEASALEELFTVCPEPIQAIKNYLTQPKESFHGGEGWPLRLLVRDINKFSGAQQAPAATDSNGRIHTYTPPKSEGLDYVKSMHARKSE